MSSTMNKYNIKNSEYHGLESVIISNDTGTSSVEILLFGSTLISWKCNDIERIFVSPDAIYNGNFNIFNILVSYSFIGFFYFILTLTFTHFH